MSSTQSKFQQSYAVCMRLLDFFNENVLKITKSFALICDSLQFYHLIVDLQQIDHNCVMGDSRSLR